MGLISAALGAASGVMADQWKEYFYCDALDANVLATRGYKRVSGKSSNKGADNIISNGSVIAVADGQCMIIVEQGKVVEVCAEPGEFVYDTSTEPSLLASGLSWTAIKETFAQIGKRFTFGGEAPKEQRVYYFNTRELTGNKYGTPSTVPFRVVDERAGIDIDVNIRCFGEYSYQITNPLLFYTKLCGNMSDRYTRDELDGQLKTELLTALQPAFAKISEMGIRYSALPGHAMELGQCLNEVLSSKWRDMRGIEVVSCGVSSVKATEEDEAMLKELQKNAAFRDPTVAAANMAGAKMEAMKAAANNAGGAAVGFMGMNMASAQGGEISQMYQMGAAQAAQAAAAAPAAPAADSWTCSCGAVNTGKFCAECGAKKPEADSWTCSCGAVNTGKFCSECGAKKPEAVKSCSKCGYTPEDQANLPKFCPECGTAF